LLFLGNEFIPGGGTWVFPYSKSLIDFGFGVLNTKMEKGLNFYANKFMSNPTIQKMLEGSEIVEDDRGFIPATGPLKKTYDNGVLAVGDAAGIMDPALAEGIKYAMSTGEIAGRTAAEAVKKENFSKRFLSQYQKEWKKKHGKRLKIMKKARKIIVEKCSDKEINFMFESIQSDNIQEGMRELFRSRAAGKKKWSKRKLAKIAWSGCKDKKTAAKLSMLMLKKVL
jgi:digeranylgeranylglycerophospholipid reductase